MTGDEIPSDCVDVALSIDDGGGATLRVTVHDDRLEERLYLLRGRGAVREGDTWVLKTDNVETITELQAHVVGMVADVVAPKPLTDADRAAVFERDQNRCRMCNKDFDRHGVVDSDARRHVRIVDHIYPDADAEAVHTPNEPSNLATVCGGCDDTMLQGDSLRFVPARIDKVLDRTDRQLLAWLQKRPLARSDWLLEHVNRARDEDRHLSRSLVHDRLLRFARLGLLQDEADIASDEAFEVYRVDFHSEAVVFLNTDTFQRHARQLPRTETVQDCEDPVIEMSERQSPNLPQSITPGR